MILKSLAVGPVMSNCYIVGSESSKEGIIVDPGDEAENILSIVKETGLQIKTIVLTHWHWDHVDATAEVKAATGAEMAIHADDVTFLQDQDSRALWGSSSPPPPPPDRLLKEGDSIDLADMHFSVLHTPGHSPGCICLLGHGILFSGDTLFNYGIGRCDLPGSDSTQMANSLKRLMTLPDETIVYPGHGPQTTIGAERRGNPFLNG